MEENNTSGLGDRSEVPNEIKRWNWGAFFLNWIWGIGNGTFIALLCFVPLANIVMPFVLGAKGNEWAWRNKQWDSIEHFKKTQRTWTLWAVWIFIISFICTILMIVIMAVFASKYQNNFNLSAMSAQVEQSQATEAPQEQVPTDEASAPGEDTTEDAASALANSPGFDALVERLTEDRKIHKVLSKKLGENMQYSSLEGEISEKSAKYSLTLSGDKGTADLYAETAENANKWTVKRLQMKDKSGKSVTLIK